MTQLARTTEVADCMYVISCALSQLRILCCPICTPLALATACLAAARGEATLHPHAMLCVQPRSGQLSGTSHCAIRLGEPLPLQPATSIHRHRQHIGLLSTPPPTVPPLHDQRSARNRPVGGQLSDGPSRAQASALLSELPEPLMQSPLRRVQSLASFLARATAFLQPS